MILLGIIIFTTILYLGQTSYYEKHWKDNLTAELTFSKKYVNAGDTLSLKEIISNGKLLPLPRLHVKFMTSNSFVFDSKDNAKVTDHYYRNDLFSVMSNQQITRTLNFKATKRGYYTINFVDTIGGDLFMRRTFADKQETNASLYVYPLTLDRHLIPSTLTNRTGETPSNFSYMEDPFNYRGSREYTPGDAFNHINWKMTARSGELYTNLYQPVIDEEVTIVANLIPFYDNDKDSLREYMINIIATLVRYYLEKGIKVHLYTNGTDIITSDSLSFPELTHISQFDSVLRGLARVDLKKSSIKVPELFTGCYKYGEALRRSLIFISNDRTQEVISEYNMAKAHFTDSTYICPEYGLVPIKADIPDLVMWEVPL